MAEGLLPWVIHCSPSARAASLVDVRLSHTTVAPAPDGGFGRFDGFEPLGGELADEPGESVAMTHLEDLVVEDRPVVMEESDDALLPEPLPGEGVAYDGSDLTGVVDGRSAPMADHAGADTPLDDAAAAFAAFDHLTADAVRAHLEGDDVDPFSQVEVADGSGFAISADDPGPVDHLAAVDDERGSLLKFLSTVKP